MKTDKTIVEAYVFNKAAKTVTFTDYAQIFIERVALITNVTSNVIIYNFAKVGYGGVVAGNVLTLDYDTTGAGFNNTDNLQIIYHGEYQPLDRDNDTITAYNPAALSVNNPSILTGTSALPLNSFRLSFTLVNVGTTPIYIKLGAAATLTNFHFPLVGGKVDNDGYGGHVTVSDYKGVVTVFGTSPKYTVTELSE